MTRSSLKKIVFFIACVLLLAFLYRHSPLKIEFLGHYDKVGVHRVNSLDKLEKSLRYFNAIELDLIYVKDTNVLDVMHPQATSTGLYFSSYINTLKDATPFLWLDIKNLDTTTASEIFQLVHSNVALKKYPKQKILIETRSPEALSLFSEAGYKTSYYLPQQLDTLEKEVLEEKINAITAVLDEQPTLSISTSYNDYTILQSYFPKRSKYLWSLSHRKIMDYNLVQEFLKDSTVKLVLVRYQPLF